MTISLFELKSLASEFEEAIDAIFACVKAVGYERHQIFNEIAQKGIIPDDIQEDDDQGLILLILDEVVKYKEILRAIAEAEVMGAIILYSYEDAVPKFREIIAQGANAIAKRIINMADEDVIEAIMMDRSSQVVIRGKTYFIFQGE